MEPERQRLQNLRARFDSFKVQALYVTKPENVYYLSRFRGGDSFLLVTSCHLYLLTDTRYEAEARESLLKGFRLLVRPRGGTYAELLKKVLRQERIRTLGFEPASLTVASYRGLRKELGPSFSLRPVHQAVESLRMVKTAQELVLIRKAVEIAEQALRKIVPKIRPGMRESEVACEVEGAMRKMGADGPSFPIIVASGRKAVFPHAQTGPHRIVPNTVLLIDAGARFRGYASDLTRTFVLSKMPRKFKEIYTLVQEAQEQAIQCVRPGVRIGDVDLAVRNFFRSNKLEKYFVHSTGHGIGLEVHESPSVFYKNETILKEGMVFTVEPGLYIRRWGGVRIEDMIRVTHKGAQCLTSFPKDLDSILLK